jgi:hypothetical protein
MDALSLGGKRTPNKRTYQGLVDRGDGRTVQRVTRNDAHVAGKPLLKRCLLRSFHGCLGRNDCAEFRRCEDALADVSVTDEGLTWTVLSDNVIDELRLDRIHDEVRGS